MTARYVPRVVIIGAGFAGLAAARTFSRKRVEVLLFDTHNYHAFLPLLHQVATAELEPEQIAYPIRNALRNSPNVHFSMARVEDINLAEQVIETDRTLISYDYLIVATGSKTYTLNIPGASEHTFRLNTLPQAIALRNHIINCFEQAAKEPDTQKRRELLTFAIVGGGATGVELAAALAELVYTTLKRDYHHLNFAEVQIILLHSGNSLVNNMPHSLQKYVYLHLRKLGVKVKLNSSVIQVNEDNVQLDNAEKITAKTIIWAAGVQGNIENHWNLPPAKKGKVVVKSTLQVIGQFNVYAIGDLAGVEINGKSLPMLAQTAIAQGKATARNILRQINGKEPEKFRYFHKGTMVILGRNAAVAKIGKITLTGFLAWLSWSILHLFLLPGWHNRLVTLINWLWNYIFGDRVARTILFPDSESLRKYGKSPKQISSSNKTI
jgi:NADH dehydrogenase